MREVDRPLLLSGGGGLIPSAETSSGYPGFRKLVLSTAGKFGPASARDCPGAKFHEPSCGNSGYPVPVRHRPWRSPSHGVWKVEMDWLPFFPLALLGSACADTPFAWPSAPRRHAIVLPSGIHYPRSPLSLVTPYLRHHWRHPCITCHLSPVALSPVSRSSVSVLSPHLQRR